jgi:murein DD-endopeptidase MepM/ murein hydrolase activator NlpD
MNYRCGNFCLFLHAVFFFSALSGRLDAQDTVHVVAKGETVYSISRSYRISPDELMRHNGITDPSRLQLGRSLRIPLSSGGPSRRTPETGTQTAGRTGFSEYRVEKNDTLYSIARAHRVSLQTLRELNNFPPNFNQIKVGEKIKVPAGTTVRPVSSPGETRSSEPRVDSSLSWPVVPKEIAYMTGKLYGVVLIGERTESVKSLTQGTVISAGPYRGFGRVAIVEVAGGYLYVYGGCESLSVKEGDRIGPGMELGKLGIDAVSGKPQLFFLVYHSNTPMDPAKAPRA